MFVSAESLPEFIANHTVERLCMPCRLVLPQGSVQPQVRRKPAGVRQALQTGAGGCGFQSRDKHVTPPHLGNVLSIGPLALPHVGITDIHRPVLDKFVRGSKW